MSYYKRICNDYGLNENQLSKVSGINTSTISTTNKSKNGKSIKNAKAENVKKLSKALDASMDEMYDWYE